MRTFFWTTLARIRAFLRPGDLDRDFDDELQTHLAMAEQDHLRRGMTPEVARRAARVELGGLTQLREAGRAARGLPWLSTFGLDVKLGLRLMRRSWGLTLAGGLAMTTAIGILVGLISTFQTVLGSTLPIEDGERVVVLMTRDTMADSRQMLPLRDFRRWRGSLRSVEDMGAFRQVERLLVMGDRPAEPASLAEMTASGFALVRVPPLLGRPLVEDDEREGATPVVVIGYEAWRARFASDPSVVGRTVRLGTVTHTVVGVMPDGFEFPVNHQFWTPLRTPASGDGPAVFGFGRLASGVTLAEAQAEAAAIGLLPSPAAPETVERLHPRVLPYTFGLTGATEGVGRQFAVMYLLVAALLFLPPCANIAILVYARNVTRQEEFAARQALGATRARLVGQLFVETLLLAAVAAGVALALVRLTGGWLESGINLPNGIGVPFWMDFGAISVRTALFAAGFALLAAVIAGVVPALQATGRLVPSGHRAQGSGSGTRLGATWTVLVVAQVAVSIVVLPSAIELVWGNQRAVVLGPGFAADEYLTARLVFDSGDAATPDSRFERVRAELTRRLQAESDVSAVTASAAVAGREPEAMIQIEGPSPAEGAGVSDRPSPRLVRVNHVDAAFFDAFDVPLLTGRTIADGDEAASVVVVSRTFARQVFGDGNPLGRRVRYISTDSANAGTAQEPGPWYEVVGVVEDFPANMSARRMYHLRGPGQSAALSLTLRADRGSASTARRLQEIAAALNPALQVEDVMRLDEVYRQGRRARYVAGLMVGGVTLSVLLLSAAGVYALMSFTVARRRREIGIRSALGAQPRRLLVGVFTRVARQLGAGAAAGMLGAFLLDRYLHRQIVEIAGGQDVPGIIPAAAALMIAVGLLAAFGPARRALRIDPTEALRDDG
jgi:predicted permease